MTVTGAGQLPAEPLPAAAEEAPIAAAALLLAALSPVELANSMVTTWVEVEVERMVVVGLLPVSAFSPGLLLAATAAAVEDAEVAYTV